jgi:hypothetical protein
MTGAYLREYELSISDLVPMLSAVALGTTSSMIRMFIVATQSNAKDPDH